MRTLRQRTFAAILEAASWIGISLLLGVCAVIELLGVHIGIGGLLAFTAACGLFHIVRACYLIGHLEEDGTVDADIETLKGLVGVFKAVETEDAQ